MMCFADVWRPGKCTCSIDMDLLSTPEPIRKLQNLLSVTQLALKAVMGLPQHFGGRSALTCSGWLQFFGAEGYGLSSASWMCSSLFLEKSLVTQTNCRSELRRLMNCCLALPRLASKRRCPEPDHVQGGPQMLVAAMVTQCVYSGGWQALVLDNLPICPHLSLTQPQ